MKRFDYRLLIGGLLIMGGILMLLDKLNILKNATSYYWTILLAIGATIFLFWYISDRSRWWAAIPGFTLAGLATSNLFIGRTGLGGLAVLGGIGVGFWAVYFRRTDQWWAIIPGGVLITLGISSALTEAYRITDTGGVFFVGLGFTFLLVALLARMKWAYIPAALLLILGFFLGAPFSGVLEYAWIGILLLAGLLLVINAMRSK
jgi:hypothetical protein